MIQLNGTISRLEKAKKVAVFSVAGQPVSLLPDCQDYKKTYTKLKEGLRVTVRATADVVTTKEKTEQTVWFVQSLTVDPIQVFKMKE